MFTFFVFEFGYEFVLYGGLGIALFSLLSRFSDGGPDHVLVWTVILYLVAVSAGPEGYSRFRVPLMPFFSLYSAYGLRKLVYGIRNP